MKGRKQKISIKETCPQKNRTASEGYVGGQTFIWITENNLTDTNRSGYGLLEFILSPSNLNAAYKQDYLVENKDELITAILRGRYRPNPVRRVAIPKDNGQQRQLGIPTVVDRFIQQAIAQVLLPLYEPQFSEHSYGFRPRRNAHHALKQCRDYITAGYSYAVDLDIEKFFDQVNHSKLIEVLSGTIKDGRVLSLIHKYLNAGVQVGGSYERSEMGVPQGGPLSPLLSNIMLVRYADDLLLMCKSKRSGQRVMGSLISFIENKLHLKVNRDKSQTAPVSRVKFLGYSFYKTKGAGRLRIHPKSVSKMKAKLKAPTSRSKGWGDARRKEALGQYIIGWVNYFRLADMRKLLLGVDEWYRRRFRMVIWKQWKRIRTKGVKLIQLGVEQSRAWEWAIRGKDIGI
uniref:RNA-directed DNA polymerase n=1 Tax=Sphingobacterium sp. (strain 21) TaxID=743722 RepID=F4C407_SPHS2